MALLSDWCVFTPHFILRKSSRLLILLQADILTSAFVFMKSLPVRHWELLSLQLPPLLPRDKKAVITSMLIIENLTQLPSDLSNHFNTLKNKKQPPPPPLAPGEKEKKDYSQTDLKTSI